MNAQEQPNQLPKILFSLIICNMYYICLFLQEQFKSLVWLATGIR